VRAGSPRFEPRVGSQAFDCGKTFEVGSPATPVKPLDLKLYLQDVRLLSASGAETELTLDQDGTWQKGSVALLDFEDDTGPAAIERAQPGDSGPERRCRSTYAPHKLRAWQASRWSRTASRSAISRVRGGSTSASSINPT
jgi:hypothetical protein